MLKPLRWFVRQRYWIIAFCGLAIGWSLHHPAADVVVPDPSRSHESADDPTFGTGDLPALPPPLRTAPSVALCQYEDETSFVPVVAEAVLADGQSDLPTWGCPPATEPGRFPVSEAVGYRPLSQNGPDLAENAAPETPLVSSWNDVSASRPAAAETPPTTCHLTDCQTGRPLATFKLGERVRNERMEPSVQPQEVDAGLAGENRITNSHDVAAERPAVPVEPYRPFLEIRGSRLDAPVIVDARNVQLTQLVQEFAAHFQVPIELEVELAGTMSAQLRAADAASALHAILQAVGMGLDIRDDRAWHVASAPIAPAGVTRVAGLDTDCEQDGDSPDGTADFEDSQGVAMVSFVTEDNLSPPPSSRFTPECSGCPSPVSADHGATRHPDASIAEMNPIDEVIRQAQAFVAAENVGAAIDLLAAAVCEHPREIRLVQQLARSYLANEDMISALAAAEQCLACDRHDPNSNTVMADVLGALGQETRAQHYREQARFLRSN